MMTQQDDIELRANSGWDERVLVFAAGRLVQTFAIVGERFLVLVDTMARPEDAAALLDRVRSRLEGRQLLVVNTPADWDHAWGNQLFAGPEAIQPAPIIASARCAARLRHPEALETLEGMRSQQPGKFDSVVPTPPTLSFEGELTIDAGDLTIRLFPTPGHTPDHLALYIPEAGLLLAGDAAELPFPLVNDYRDLPQLRASLGRMAALAPRHALYCHAPVECGPRLLSENLAYFENLEARCRVASTGIAALPAADEELESWAGFSFEAAVPTRWPLAALAAEEAQFYRDAHRRAIRAMSRWLAEAGC
jgi:glyoxylase-like metal-dependent hydrolase (beta-lactamase superfamily II)